MPKEYIPLNIAILIGNAFDLLGKLLHTDLPVNSDRMKKFGTPTDYLAEKIRDSGYIQNYSIEDIFKETCEWYLSEINRNT
ncbi:MAG: hypothetical protein P9X26_06435 [Candidatus Stygibacter frigidus]|nr:hypothetical protein [Candidatus Stygibacter frigidus]